MMKSSKIFIFVALFSNVFSHQANENMFLESGNQDGMTNLENSPSNDQEDIDGLDLEDLKMDINNKPNRFTIDSMEAQYIKLLENLIQLNQVISLMRTKYPMEMLVKDPQWQTLVSLYNSIKKILSGVNPLESTRRKRSPSGDFNGMIVSYPQFIRLVKLQEKAVKLDNIMMRLSEGKDPSLLAKNSKWNELVSLRKSLQKLLPLDHPSNKNSQFQGQF